MTTNRQKQLEADRGGAPVVSYSRLASARAVRRAEPAAEAPHLTAAEVPLVAIDPADAIGAPPDLGEPLDLASVGGVLAPRRRRRWIVPAALAAVVAVAAGIGMLAANVDRAPVATFSAPAAESAPGDEIAGIKRQIEDLAASVTASAAETQLKIGVLKTRLAELEGPAPVPADGLDAPLVRDVTTGAGRLAATAPAGLAAAEPAPAEVATVPPLPRTRPEHIEVPVDPDAPVEASAASPPAPSEEDFVRNIARILAEPPAASAEAPAAIAPPVDAMAPPPAEAMAPPLAAEEWPIDEPPVSDGPIPPEPIPNVADEPGPAWQ